MTENMKTKYTLIALAAALMAVSCVQESDTVLDGLKVSSSYVTLPLDGGTKTITIDAADDWTFDFDIQVDTTYVDPVKGNKTETISRNQLTQLYDDKGFDDSGKESRPIWLTLNPTSGKKGKTDVTFTSTKCDAPKQVTLYLKSGDLVQNIIVSRVKTEKEEMKVTSVKDIAAGADGTTFRAQGYCTKISSTSYGNWYLSDATVDGSTVKELYIYGTVNDAGSYDWKSFNIAVGDLVTVEGPKTNYNGTIELVDARFISVEKALMIPDKTEYTVTKESKPFEIKIKQNGETFISESKADWLKVDPEYDLKNGTITVTVTPDENTTGANRTGVLWFQSTKMGKDKDGKDKKEATEVNISVTQVAETVSGTLLDLRNKIAPGTSKAPIKFDYTLTEKATVTFVDGKNIFIETGSGDNGTGLLIYDDNGVVKLSVGQTIEGRVFGQGYSYSGLPEATAFDISLAKVGAAPKISSELPKPTTVTLAELKANWDKYFCRLVEVKNVAVTDTVAATYEAVEMKDGKPVTQQNSKTKAWEYKKSSGDRSGIIADDAEGTNAITVNVQCKKYLNMKKDTKYDVVGTACYYSGAKAPATKEQIYIWQPSQVKEVKAE